MSRGRFALIQQVSHSSPSRPEVTPLNFYRRFPGDYARDTTHLTLAEHGAFTLLLDSYYSTEKPIPSTEFACAVCHAHTGAEVKVVKKVLAYFFKRKGKKWVNTRAEEEIRFAQDKRKAAKNSVKSRWDKYKRNTNVSQNSEHEQKSAYGSRNTIQTPDSRLQNTPSSDRSPQDHKTVESSSSSGKLDDFKKSFLSKCEDPHGIVAAMIEIVCARAEKSGIQIRSEAYIAKAIETFDTQSGQDKEDLQQFLRRAK